MSLRRRALARDYIRMPLVLTADEQTLAMELGSAELKYLFAKERVDIELQAKFFHSGCTTVARLATFVKDDAELRELLTKEFDADPAKDLKTRSMVAGVICAFKSATTRTDEMAKFQGELDAKKLGKPLQNNEYHAMKHAYEALYGAIEDADAPAKVYLEKRIAELESGELRAEPLSMVLNREQDNDETLTPHWDATGNLKLKRTTGDIAEPHNTEELRRRIEVMFNGLMFIALLHTNRAELQGITPTLSHQYSSYLLGEFCWDLVAKDNEGRTVAAPNWKLVLHYELAIRKQAYRWMMEGQGDFRTCLKRAWLDPLIKERHFTTPLAIASANGVNYVSMETPIKDRNKRSLDDSTPTPPRRGGRGGRKGGKGNKGKGNKGGKGRGAAGGGAKGCASSTPDGRSICYGYNDSNQKCRRKGCNFLHVCGRCFQKHPMYACSGNGRQIPNAQAGLPETQGSS